MDCERCHAQTLAITCSMFNTEMICWTCKTRESNHPLYENARSAETDAVLAGDYNFPGIGLPEDLR